MLKLALIEEDKCIGCTKCIQACPTDAIIGSENFMHSVISEECIGCKLCIAPCPVDCIVLIEPKDNFEQKPKEFIVARAKAKKIREKNFIKLPSLNTVDNTIDQKKDYIARALERVKRKKSNS